MTRIVDEEPWLILAVKNRKTVLMKKRGPIREASLEFAETVARILRSREFWASMVAYDIAGDLYFGARKKIYGLPVVGTIAMMILGQ